VLATTAKQRAEECFILVTHSRLQQSDVLHDCNITQILCRRGGHGKN
jgi:hypothetical protein